MTQSTEPNLLTIAELARNLGLPESTTRYYCNRFAEYLPSVGEGRRKRYKPEALEKLRTIAETMRRDKNAYAVDLALRNEGNGETVQVPAVQQTQALTATALFAEQVLAHMESQTKAMQDIAAAVGMFAERLSLTVPAPQTRPESVQPAVSAEDTAALQREIASLREQIRSSESVHQNDLDQMRKWLSRLGEAVAGK